MSIFTSCEFSVGDRLYHFARNKEVTCVSIHYDKVKGPIVTDSDGKKYPAYKYVRLGGVNDGKSKSDQSVLQEE